MRFLAAAIVLVFAGGPGIPAADTPVPPSGFISGAYEILGRSPGSLDDDYKGWARLIAEENAFEIVRCIDGTYAEGRADMTTRTADAIPAIEMRFDHRGRPLAATCTIGSDFDNLPRLMCLTTPVSEPEIETPGVESYFPIVWPVPVDYFDCP